MSSRQNSLVKCKVNVESCLKRSRKSNAKRLRIAKVGSAATVTVWLFWKRPPTQFELISLDTVRICTRLFCALQNSPQLLSQISKINTDTNDVTLIKSHMYQ